LRQHGYTGLLQNLRAGEGGGFLGEIRIANARAGCAEVFRGCRQVGNGAIEASLDGAVTGSLVGNRRQGRIDGGERALCRIISRHIQRGGLLQLRAERAGCCSARMRTVKALAIEPMQRRNWDQISAETINMHYRLGKFSLIGNSFTDFLGQLLPITIIVIGAQDVFDQTLTVGALIAFQMISGRVSGPLISIVGLINEYQQTALSVRMVSKIMNHPPEGRVGAGGLRPQLAGKITFEEVTFRYPGASVAALDRASFTIPAGAVVGIVGRSGSGKTTMTRLIQGLYGVQEGIIRFDGIDARELELPHLRRQTGVVLQENFLFRGSVRENICMAKTDATFEDIVAAAQASGADEFIERLPQGYDTLLEENAANLSGGQKQRLSIARALLTKPRILILDEAASALDPESESIFIRNLSRIAVGRTVVMISHRLSTLVNAHTILVMQQGRLVDSGRHEELLSRCATYQELWNQQTSHL